MIIDTKFSGQIEINDKDIIYFEDGLLGFEDVKKYVVININEAPPFMCLQSVEGSSAAFIIINPWDVFADYEIDLDDDELLSLGDADIKNLMLYTLVTITEENITANLIGPVIINTNSRKGKQTVLYKSNYTTRHNIMQFLKKV